MRLRAARKSTNLPTMLRPGSAQALGNVLAVITDRKTRPEATRRVQDPTGGYLPCVASYSDYYPFFTLSCVEGGWEMPGRSSAAGATRYGFNGKENDVETGFQDYGMRQYDRRVSRFFSPDPLIVGAQKYPELSSYCLFASCATLQG